MLIDKIIKVKIGSKNLNHFKNLNYKFQIGETIEVKIDELMSNNKTLIKVKCDICGATKQIEYRSYFKNISKYHIYCCNTSCSKIKEHNTKIERYGDNYELDRVDKMKLTNKKRYGNEKSSQIFRNEKNQNFFITELKEIYKDKNFNYTKINYKNNYTQVEIECEKHGSFKIRPNELLIGQGCKKCNRENIIKKSLEIYLDKAKQIHNNKYDYSKLRFINLSSKITIICPLHGEFQQTLHGHLTGRECKKCSNINRRLKFLDRIAENLKNGHQITPSYNKKSCVIFDEISKNENIHIQHAMNGGEYYIPSLGYWLDGYDIINNVAYEYDEKNHFIKGKLRQKDIDRQKEIKKLLKCKFIRIKE